MLLFTVDETKKIIWKQEKFRSSNRRKTFGHVFAFTFYRQLQKNQYSKIASTGEIQQQ